MEAGYLISFGSHGKRGRISGEGADLVTPTQQVRSYLTPDEPTGPGDSDNEANGSHSLMKRPPPREADYTLASRSRDRHCARRTVALHSPAICQAMRPRSKSRQREQMD